MNSIFTYKTPKMRRLKILFFWIFINKNNITFSELMSFLVKPKINTIAKKYVTSITKNESNFELKFTNTPDSLFWPENFSLNRLDQVICETMDANDWHFYQKQGTVIEQDEYLLDIGTAEGLFPLTVVEKCKQIYMIEPSKVFYECLNKTFKNHTEKIAIYNVAVGNEDGLISFDENSLDGKVAIENQENTYKISINKIDTLLSNNQKVTYLKADIEGFESEMLKGAEQTIKRNKPKIAITTYHTQNDPKEIIDLIKGFVPEYKYYVKGIYEKTPKPVMIHFWV